VGRQNIEVGERTEMKPDVVGKLLINCILNHHASYIVT